MAASIDLSNASLMGYSVEKKYLGENFHYATVERYSVVNKFAESANQHGVSSIISKYEALISNENNDPQTFTVNGKTLGEGRLLSISFDRDNPVRIGEFTAEFEIYKGNGDEHLYNMQDSSDHGGTSDANYYLDYNYLKSIVNSATPALLEDLSEDISSTVGEDGQLSLSHSISIKYIGAETEALDDAKYIAAKLFNADHSYHPLSLFEGYDKDSINEGLATYSEDYDLVNNSFSFSKDVRINNENPLTTPSGYKYFLNTSRSLSESAGIFSVTENGEVTLHGGEFQSFGGHKKRNDYGIFDLEVGYFVDGTGPNKDLVQIKTGYSFARCSGLYRRHSYLLDKQHLTDLSGSFDNYPLYPVPIDVSTQVNSGANTASYSVTFTNDPKISGTYDFSGGVTGGVTDLYASRENNLSISRDEQSIITVTDNGTMTFFRPNHTLIDAEEEMTAVQASTFGTLMSLSENHAENFYSEFLKTEDDPDYNKSNAVREKPLILVSTSMGCPRYGKQFTYTKTYSNSPEFVNPTIISGVPVSPLYNYSNRFTKISIEVSDNAPITQKSTHMIPNHGEIVHHGFFQQTELGSRSVSISAQMARAPENIFPYPIGSNLPPANPQNDINDYLNILHDLARQEVKNVLIDIDGLIIQELWISNSDYTISSEGTIDMSVEAQYTAGRSNTNIDPVISY